MPVAGRNAQQVHRDTDPTIKHSLTASRGIHRMTDSCGPGATSCERPQPGIRPFPSGLSVSGPFLGPSGLRNWIPTIHLGFPLIFTETPLFL